MTTQRFAESVVEDTALAWLEAFGYPPDKQEQAARTVLEQAEVLSQEWAIA
jgi:hypothetical protein